jgi:hypothetical protein
VQSRIRRTSSSPTIVATGAWCEALEARCLLTTFFVTSGANAGPGTLR